MLFPVFLIAALAVFSHSSSALSIPETVPLNQNPQSNYSGIQSNHSGDHPASSLHVIVAAAVEVLYIKQKNIENGVAQHDAQISISVELEAFIGVFQQMVSSLKSCGCASQELVNLEWYKETLVGIFLSIQVVIDVVFDSEDKSLILLAIKLCTVIQVHISNLIDISITIDVKAAAAVLDNVHAYTFAKVSVDIVELIGGKIAHEIKGSEPIKPINGAPTESPKKK